MLIVRLNVLGIGILVLLDVAATLGQSFPPILQQLGGLSTTKSRL
jgi:hypothetical protein